MFVRAIVTEGINGQAILVPQQGISRNQKGDPYALVVDDTDTVNLHMLTIDRAIDDKWLVSSGLKPGDRVIVEGLQKVRPGAAVNVVPAGASPKKKASPAVTEKKTQPSEKTK